MKTLLLLVTYTVKAGARENFLKEVVDSGLLETIRREEGCLSYRYFLEAEDPQCLLLVEKWATERQQQAHLERPHMRHLAEIKARWIERTSIERIYIEEGD